jgi:hypothetical protein
MDKHPRQTHALTLKTSSNTRTQTGTLRDPTPRPTKPGCPTVTETKKLCPDCKAPDCLTISTVTQGCGCPDDVETVTVEFPCDCASLDIPCWTSWAFETEVCEGPPERKVEASAIGGSSRFLV